MVTVPTNLDLRLNAFRPDLADRRLQGQVTADRFVEGERRRIGAPSASLRAQPRSDAAYLTEALQGEVVRVFEQTLEGWAWGQLEADSYVGWLPLDALQPLGPEPTHRVHALRTFLYPGPDLKLPPVAAFSFGSLLALAPTVETRGTLYRPLLAGEGAVAATHVEPLDAPKLSDFVAVAERFLGVPYLWGGKTSLGLDCSALIQLSLMAAGRSAPRDTDMQEAALGQPLAQAAPLQRGDLVFWKGHVGVMQDGASLLHANAHHMQVASEPLAGAVARIARIGSKVSSIRRLS